MTFDILWENEQFIAINKPACWLVHRTGMSAEKRYVLQALRNQVGQHLFPIHRLDRRTSGVLLFGKTSEAVALAQQEMQGSACKKSYLALVRGWLAEDSGTISHPTKDPEGKKAPQGAISHFVCLGKSELPWAIGKRYPTSRFSLVELTIETGRRHQIRQHLEHLRHPIIGDKLYGDVAHNHFFWAKMSERRHLLHAHRLVFMGNEILAPLPEDFVQILNEVQLL